MLESLKNLFAPEFFIPYGQCYLWTPHLVWLHVASDLLIGLAYYSVAIMLVYFVHKRPDVPFQGIFRMFGAFSFACGTSHLMAVSTLWYPEYWLSGAIILITAFVCLYTAAALLRLIPKGLALPSTTQQEATTQKLAQEISVSEAAVRHRIWAEAALKLSETRFRLIFENAAIGIVFRDVAGQVMAANSAFQQMLGYSQKELCGMHFTQVTHPESLTPEKGLYQEMVAGRRDFYQLEKCYLSKEGQRMWGNLTVSLVRDSEGNPQFSIAMVENITQRKQAESALRFYQEHLEELVEVRTAVLTAANKQLSWQASHDPLTGLVNRREFEKCLERAISNAKTFEYEYTLCYMDLDRFKIVNDTCGHLAGDELLRQVSCLLQSRCRKTDTLARLGGDEFGLLLYQCSLAEAQRVVQALHESIQQFRFVWQDKTFTLGISIGVVAIDPCLWKLEDIINAADTACYAAKNRGRNQVVYEVKAQALQEQFQ
jgi:diguanylate cyclase (GGDEF)-like protein/PAS domain S-box-containing protein